MTFLGCITETYPGRDGHTRVAKIQYRVRTVTGSSKTPSTTIQVPSQADYNIDTYFNE